jgi:DNA-directed RNA polymerase specialized sigma24 family protein
MRSVRRRIEDILEHHEQDEKQLVRQLQEERIACEEDVDALRDRLKMHGVDYSLDRVITSRGADDALLNVLQAMDERRERCRLKLERIQRSLDVIWHVYEFVLDLEPRYRAVIMALYYPRRSYAAAAEEVGVDVRTISRRRSDAVDQLVREAEIHGIFEKNTVSRL